MTAPATPPPAPKRPGDRVRSFLGYAFVISLLIHVIVLPFFGLQKRAADKAEPEKVSLTKKIRVRVPTPPPPTPTPKPTPPPTPPPKQTPPPVKQTNPPPQVKLKVNPPKTTSKSKSSSSENKYVPPKVGNENGVPQGNAASAPAATAAPVAATGVPATPVPTKAPTATPVPKPACAVPNVDAKTINTADAEYPEIAAQQGAVGTSKIKVTLDAEGHVVTVDLAKSAGLPALDEAAKRAARASTYSPEIVNCVKTAGSYLFQVDFTGQ